MRQGDRVSYRTFNDGVIVWISDDKGTAAIVYEDLPRLGMPIKTHIVIHEIRPDGNLGKKLYEL